MDRRQYLAETAALVKSMIATRNDISRKIKEKTVRLDKIAGADQILEQTKHVITNEKNEIQKTLKSNIDSLVTIAMNIVYEGRDLQFAMIFDKSASGTSQYKPVLIENNEEFSPKDEQCGGALDVCSYALRIILKSFEKPKGRDFMLYDEPFKFLGGGILGERAIDMAKQINTAQNIQSLMISHDEISISRADVIYHVEHDGKRSKVTRISGEDPEPKETIERVLR